MSKEYDHFWKFHNKDNMDVHAVKLIEQQAKRIKELEAEIIKLKTQMLPNEYEHLSIEAMDEGKALKVKR